jgi:hypothetical protein
MNLFEKHVEKIVLAVAAAGALYLGYLAFQPVTLPNSDVRVEDVENKLADQIRAMKATEDTNRSKIPAVPSPQFATSYQQLIRDQPLRNELVNANLPPFAPVGLALNGTPNAPNGPNAVTEGDYKVVTPAPVPPELITAKAWQQPVADISPNTPGVPPTTPVPGAALPTRDQNAVVIQGYLPVSIMLADMARQKPQDKTALPPALQHVSIYRIEVQRRQRTNSGWSDWTRVTPTKASPQPVDITWSDLPQPADVPTLMNQIDSQFKQIVLPDFYPGPQGAPNPPPILVAKTALPKEVTDRIKQLTDDLTKATNAPPGAGPRLPAFSIPTFSAPTFSAAPSFAGTANDPAASIADDDPQQAQQAQQPTVTVSAPTLNNQVLLPFCFWDETVETDHTYQYQVQVRYLNPTYGWIYGLKDPSMKDKPTLDSKWVLVPNPVVVNPDMRFFIMNAGINRGGQSVSVRVYKRTAGKWYWGEFTSQPGMPIAGQIPLVDQKPIVNVPVETGYTVVDVSGTPNSSDAHVVLLETATSKLTTRETQVDRLDPENAQLYKDSAQRIVTAPATLPAARGRGPIRGPVRPSDANDPARSIAD